LSGKNDMSSSNRGRSHSAKIINCLAYDYFSRLFFILSLNHH
jgi:hypothetical protein